MELLVLYSQINSSTGEPVQRRRLVNTLSRFMSDMDAKGRDYELIDAYPVTDTAAEGLRWDIDAENEAQRTKAKSGKASK
jgi:hypothetical protein